MKIFHYFFKINIHSIWITKYKIIFRTRKQVLFIYSCKRAEKPVTWVILEPTFSFLFNVNENKEEKISMNSNHYSYASYIYAHYFIWLIRLSLYLNYDWIFSRTAPNTEILCQLFFDDTNNDIEGKI